MKNTKTKDFSIKINFNESIKSILDNLYKKNINSILVEGGTKTINKFINSNSWDEARVFRSNKNIKDGIKAPNFSYKNEILRQKISGDKLSYYINSSENKS